LAQLLAFVIIGSAMAGVLLFVRNREVSPYTDDASIDADVVHVAASVSGRIVRLDVGENQLVKAGDVLFEIDPEPYRLRVELASAELQSAQALLDSQRRTVATETSNASIAADQVVQARYSLQLASSTLSRLEPLLGKGYVSAQQVDDARTAKSKAQTAYAQAVEQAAATKTAIGTTDNAAAQVEALLDWPGIHTWMLTCFIVGLTTVGETMQKLSLRIVGCCVGPRWGCWRSSISFLRSPQLRRLPW